MQFRIICVCVGVLSILLWSCGASAGEVSVTGGAVLHIAPTHAKICFNVVSTAEDADVSTRLTAETYNRVLGSLEAWDALNVRTGGFSISPNWKRDRRGNEIKIEGYTSRYAVVVRMSDLSLVNDVIVAIADAGVKNYNLSYHAEMTDSLQEYALQQAVEQARGRARAMASAAGARIGELLHLNSAGSTTNHREIHSTDMSPPNLEGPRVTPIAVVLRVSVSARWKILNPDEIGQFDPDWDVGNYVVKPR